MPLQIAPDAKVVVVAPKDSTKVVPLLSVPVSVVKREPFTPTVPTITAVTEPKADAKTVDEVQVEGDGVNATPEHICFLMSLPSTPTNEPSERSRSAQDVARLLVKLGPA